MHTSFRLIALITLRLIALITLASLVACASSPVYAPATYADGPGYSSTRLTENRMRVTFVGQSTTSADQVRNFALLRAAELTLMNGYDWFKIVARENEEQARDREPRVTIGVGNACYPFGCGVLRSRWYTGVQVDSHPYRDRYRTSLEILMGTGEPDAPNEVYNAEELSHYLRDEAGLPPTPDPALEPGLE